LSVSDASCELAIDVEGIGFDVDGCGSGPSTPAPCHESSSRKALTKEKVTP